MVVSWKYFFRQVTSWFGMESAAVPPMQFERMIGVDGRYDGVARRYPGHVRYRDTFNALRAGVLSDLERPELDYFEVASSPGSQERVKGFVVHDPSAGVELWHRKSSDEAGTLLRTPMTSPRAGLLRVSGTTSSWYEAPPLMLNNDGAWITSIVFHDDGTTGGPVPYVAGVIHAAGHLSGNSAGGVFRLRGGRWEAVGVPAFEGLPRVLYSYGGKLYLGGGFHKYNGRRCRRLAVWDGTGWVQVGGGVDNGEILAMAEAPATWGTRTPRLRAFGSFTLVNDGTSSPYNLAVSDNGEILPGNTFASGLNVTQLRTAAAYNGKLYAAGAATQDTNMHRVYELSSHSGIWTAAPTTGFPPSARIGRALAVFAGRLYYAWGAGESAGLSYFDGSGWAFVNVEIIEGRTPRALIAAGSFLYVLGDFDIWASIASPKIIRVNASGVFSAVTGATFVGAQMTPTRQIAAGVHLDPDTYSWSVPVTPTPSTIYGIAYDEDLQVIASVGGLSNPLKSYDVTTGAATDQGSTNTDQAWDLAYDGTTFVYMTRPGGLFRVNISGGVASGSSITPPGTSNHFGLTYFAGDVSTPVYYGCTVGGIAQVRKCAGNGSGDTLAWSMASTIDETSTIRGIVRDPIFNVFYFTTTTTLYLQMSGNSIPVYSIRGRPGGELLRVKVDRVRRRLYWQETWTRGGTQHWRVMGAIINSDGSLRTPYTVQWYAGTDQMRGMDLDQVRDIMYLALDSGPSIRRIALAMPPSLRAAAIHPDFGMLAVGPVRSPGEIARWGGNDPDVRISSAALGRYLYLFSSDGDHRTLSWQDSEGSWEVARFGPGITWAPAPTITMTPVSNGLLPAGAYKGYLRYVDTKRRRYSALSLDSASKISTGGYPATGTLATPSDWGVPATDLWGYDRAEGLQTLGSTDETIPAGGNIYRFARGSIGEHGFLSYTFGAADATDDRRGTVSSNVPDADLPTDPRRLYDLVREQLGELGAVYGAITHQQVLFVLEARDGYLDLRWSNTSRDEPENFPPLNSYPTRIPVSAAPTCKFVSSDDYLYLIGGTRIYRIQKSGRIIGIVERYNGHPFVHKSAVVSTKARIYAATTAGLVIVDTANGAAIDADGIAKVFRQRWLGTFNSATLAGTEGKLLLAYDAKMNALYIHNPQVSETAILWISTGQWTGLVGMSAVAAISAPDLDEDSSDRAYFLTAQRWLHSPNWLASTEVPQTLHGLQLYPGQSAVKYNTVALASGTGTNSAGETVSYLDFPAVVVPPPSSFTTTIAMGSVDPTADQWLLGAGSTKVTAVALPDDDSTSYIVSDYPGELQRFFLAAHTIPPGATITEVKLRVRAGGGGGGGSFPPGYVRLHMRLGSTAVDIEPLIPVSGWSTTEVPVERPGGGSWTRADFDTLRVGVRVYWPSVSVSTLGVIVTYTLPASGNPPAEDPFSRDGVETLPLAGTLVAILDGAAAGTLAKVTSNTGSRLYLDRVIQGLGTPTVALDPVVFGLVGSPLWDTRGQTDDTRQRSITALGVSVQKVYSPGPAIHSQTAPVSGSGLLRVGGVRSGELAANEPLSSLAGALPPMRAIGEGPYHQATPGVRTMTALDESRPSSNVVAVACDGNSLHPVAVSLVSNLAFDMTKLEVHGALENVAVSGPGAS